MPNSDPADSGPDGSNTHNSPAIHSDAPLPSTSTPCGIACKCLNVQIAARVPDDLKDKVATGPSAFEHDSTHQVWLPTDAEKILHLDLVVFETEKGPDDPAEAPSWRKCLLCGVRLYESKGRKKEDTAPSDEWVSVDFSSGILFGKALDEALDRPALPFTGLQLDVPKDSTFGRPPQSETSEAPKLPSSFLPPIPDPFFLPPPFIPNHHKLREMCKSAVVTLQDKRSEIEADIVAYVNKRMEDMRQLEDEVRGEVEVLWTRYAEGHKTETERSPSQTRPRESFDGKKEKEHEVPFTDLERPSGVSPSQPKIPGQHNVHLAQNATSSLLAASISANAFHAPPPKQFDENKLEHIAKTVSREQGVDKEVAMSFAFSTMEEAALARGNRKKEEAAAEELEVEVEEEEKGIDSWIGLERAQAKKRVERLTRRQSSTSRDAKAEKPAAASDKPDTKEDKAEKAGGKAENGEPARSTSGGEKEKKKGVKFQEPEPVAPTAVESPGVGEGSTDGLACDNEDEDEYVFDMETDTPTTAPALPVQEPPKSNREARIRTMLDDNLSRTFAADAPSHRAAWRRLEGQVSSVLRRSVSDDEDDTPATSMARSMPIDITMPRRSAPAAEYQIKTSVTDREGVVVPNLIRAMRERPGSNTGTGTGARRVSIGRQGRRASAALGREREQVMSYAADPGAVFESLAEAGIDSDDEETPHQNGKFVPPHVLAQRSVKQPELGWRSLAS